MKTGLGIILKVMAGDTVSFWGKSYYHLNASPNVINTYAVSNALLSLLTSFAGSSAVSGKGVTGATLNGNAPTTGPLPTMLNGTYTPPGNTIPKAGVNWILFDEQFRPVANGYDAVNSSGDYVKTHTMTANVSQNGYLYVYCSDESNADVYFDNLQVMHSRGPLLEETHYYPFGLTMAGISSSAAGGTENKKKYNKGSELQHKEFSDGSGLEEYDTHFRQLDPQIGRWLQVDPKALDCQSTYEAMADNPIKYNDAMGDVYHLNGDKNDITLFLQYLGSITGNTYATDEDGNIQRTNKTLNTKTNKQISGTLSKDVEKAIHNSETVTFNLINDDKKNSEVYVDKYKTGTIDLKDLTAIKEKSDNAFLAGTIGHILDEYLKVPDITKRSKGNTDDPVFDAAHDAAKVQEGRIVTEMLGIPNHARVENGDINPETGKTTTTYDYGKVKYTVTSGVVTTSSISRGKLNISYTDDNIIQTIKKEP